MTMLAAVAVTAVSEWIAVAAGANRAQWNGATWLQVALLAMVSGLGARAALAQVRAAYPGRREPAAGADSSCGPVKGRRKRNWPRKAATRIGDPGSIAAPFAGLRPAEPGCLAIRRRRLPSSWTTPGR
jgi:hypothetical protein